MLVALVPVTLAAVGREIDRQAQTVCLAQAKQVGLALKLFAGDHTGDYPRGGVPADLHTPKTSNAAFAPLLPTYTESERIFSNELSAYQTKLPDNAIDVPYQGKPDKTLEAGENVYSYVLGLHESMDGGYPLVVDGTDGTGHYVSDPGKRGGVWNGKNAILVHLDCSGQLAALEGPEDARFVPLGADLAGKIADSKPEENLLDVKRFGDDVRLLDPAVAPAAP